MCHAITYAYSQLVVFVSFVLVFFLSFLKKRDMKLLYFTNNNFNKTVLVVFGPKQISIGSTS